MYQFLLRIRKLVSSRRSEPRVVTLAEHERFVAAMLADHINELAFKDDLIASLEADTYRYRFALEAAGVEL